MANVLVNFRLLLQVTQVRQVSAHGYLASGRGYGVGHNRPQSGQKAETHNRAREKIYFQGTALKTYFLQPGLLSHRPTPVIKPLKESEPSRSNLPCSTGSTGLGTSLEHMSPLGDATHPNKDKF